MIGDILLEAANTLPDEFSTFIINKPLADATLSELTGKTKSMVSILSRIAQQAEGRELMDLLASPLHHAAELPRLFKVGILLFVGR